MARAQSSLAMSAAFCSSATMVRPEFVGHDIGFRLRPFGVGANGTIVRSLVGSIATHHYSLHYVPSIV